MNKLNDICEIFDQVAFREKMFLLALACLLATHSLEELVQIGGFIMCFIGLFYNKILKGYLFWVVLGLVLLTNQYQNYFHSANHYWVLIYTTFAIGLHNHLKTTNCKNFNVFRYLLIVVFGFATFYKIKSSFFRSGRLLSDYILTEETLPRTFGFIFGDKYYKAVEAYMQNSDLLACKFPVDGQTIELILPDPTFVTIIKGITIAVIFVEVIICFLFLNKKSFYGKHFPLIVILFVWSTCLMRNEYAFFSLLCILTFFARPQMLKLYKLAMVGTIIMFLSFEVSNISILF